MSVNYERQLADIQLDMAEIVAIWQHRIVIPANVKTELAELEAKLVNLQCHGLDSIYICESNSSKDTAKALRKELIKRVDGIQQKIDDVFKELESNQPR